MILSITPRGRYYPTAILDTETKIIRTYILSYADLFPFVDELIQETIEKERTLTVISDAKQKHQLDAVFNYIHRYSPSRWTEPIILKRLKSVDASTYQKITGTKNRTNQYERDAALLAYTHLNPAAMASKK